MARLPPGTDVSTERASRLLALLPTAHATLLQGVSGVSEHIKQMCTTLPCTAPPDDLLLLLQQTPHATLAQQLVYLRELFPSADVGVMVARYPALATREATELDSACASLREAMPNATTEFLDSLVEARPQLLDLTSHKDDMMFWSTVQWLRDAGLIRGMG